MILFLAGIEQHAIPRQMWGSIREQISRFTILAVAPIMITVSVALPATVGLLRRRSERFRGIKHS